MDIAKFDTREWIQVVAFTNLFGKFICRSYKEQDRKYTRHVIVCAKNAKRDVSRSLVSRNHDVRSIDIRRYVLFMIRRTISDAGYVTLSHNMSSYEKNIVLTMKKNTMTVLEIGS